MNPIRCFLADDESLAREIIETYISRLDRLQLVGSCSTGSDVYTALKSQPVDLLLLDIQMPQITGIELLRSLRNPPAVILTTAYPDFALEGYELNVLDYLLKPISFTRFMKAIDKYESFYHPGQGQGSLVSPKIAYDPQAFLYVKIDKKMVRVLLSDILYIEGVKDYVNIQLVNQSLITYQSLTYFEEKLSADHFLRIHRSYIVSLQHISSYSASSIEIGTQTIPIGGTYTREVLRKLSGD